MKYNFVVVGSDIELNGFSTEVIRGRSLIKLNSKLAMPQFVCFLTQNSILSSHKLSQLSCDREWGSCA